MTDDHVFIDAYGNKEDKSAMEQGWPGYFAWFPDYTIEIEHVLHSGSTVALMGYAGGTYRGVKGHSWRIPAAWRVVVRGDKVSIWQVYADSKIPYDSMKGVDEKIPHQG